MQPSAYCKYGLVPGNEVSLLQYSSYDVIINVTNTKCNGLITITLLLQKVTVMTS